MLLLTVLLVVVGVGLALILYFTPAMSARSIVVTGTGAVTREEVLDAAQVRPGTPLLQINTNQVADRVAGDPAGGQRAGAASVPVGAADHHRRASPAGGEGLSGRPAPVRPRRRRLRDRAAAAGAALPRCRRSRADRSGHQGRTAGADRAAARGRGSGGPDRGAVGGVDHPHAGRRAGGDLGDAPTAPTRRPRSWPRC